MARCRAQTGSRRKGAYRRVSIGVRRWCDAVPGVLSALPRPKVCTKQCTSRSQAGCTLLLLHARLCIHTHSHTATRVCARRHVASFQLPFAAFDYILLRNQHSVLSDFATGTRLVALMATVLERGYIFIHDTGNGTPHTCFMTA